VDDANPSPLARPFGRICVCLSRLGKQLAFYVERRTKARRQDDASPTANRSGMRIGLSDIRDLSCKSFRSSTNAPAPATGTTPHRNFEIAAMK
jgi:hypothetical protein